MYAKGFAPSAEVNSDTYDKVERLVAPSDDDFAFRWLVYFKMK